MTTLTKEQFDAYLAANPDEKQPFVDPQGASTYVAETDGEITYNVDANGDLLVECGLSKRFTKYPWPGAYTPSV